MQERSIQRCIQVCCPQADLARYIFLAVSSSPNRLERVYPPSPLFTICPKLQPHRSHMSKGATSSDEPPFHIYLSHASEDKETIARPLRRRLREHGLSVFLDEKSLHLGDHCPKDMKHAMETAPVGVFILSPEFVAKKWPMRELLAFVRRYDHAKQHKQNPPSLIPIFYRLSAHECLDSALFDTYSSLFVRHGLFERAWDRRILLEDIKHALDMSTTLLGVQNDVGATNDDIPKMASIRESFVTIVQNSILAHLGIKTPQVVVEGSYFNTPPFRIFLSHAGEDKETIALPLYKRLREHGLSVFLDEESFRLGDHCPQVMEYAMETAPVGVFILSPEYVAMEWPMRELLTFVRRYDNAKEHNQDVPLLIPVFYRFPIHECRDPAIFHTHSGLFLRRGLFERACKGVISVEDINHALHTSATLWSIRNDVGATNDTKPHMSSTRESFITNVENIILDKLGIKRLQVVDRAPTHVIHQSVQQDKYTPSYKVPPNPPRLTLQYSSPTTCEGRLRAAVLRESGSQIVAVVASGQGGVGKTCALRGLAKDTEIKRVFNGGVLYIELGNDAAIPNLVQGIADIVDFTGGSALANEIKAVKSVGEASRIAFKWFSPHKCLFLVDDIWYLNGIDSSVLQTLGHMVNTSSRMVYTTRDRHFLKRADKIIDFTPKEAFGELSRQMLMTHAGFEQNAVLDNGNKSAFEYFLNMCQGLPLGFGIIGGSILLCSKDCERKQDAWSAFYNDVSSQQEDLMKTEAEPYGTLPKIVDLSLQVLEKRSGHKRFWLWFRALSVLQKQQSVPIQVLQKLWDLDSVEETKTVVSSFADVSIVQRIRKPDSISIKLHDLILDIAARKAADERETEIFFQTLVHNYMAFGGSKEKDKSLVSHKRTPGEVLKQYDRSDAIKRFRSEESRSTRSGLTDKQVHVHNQSGIPEKHVPNTLKWYSEHDEGAHDVVLKGIEPAASASKLEFAWWETEDDGFIHSNACRILQSAGYAKEILWLLSRPQWIVKRLLEGGIVGLEQDLEHGRSVCNGNDSQQANRAEHLQMIGRAARLSMRFVNNNRRVEEAWFQLHGRLLQHATQNEFTNDFVQRMERCAPKPWLKASAGLLQQADSGGLQVVNVRGIVWCTLEEPDATWILSGDKKKMHVGRYEKSNESYKYAELKFPKGSGDIIMSTAFLLDRSEVMVADANGRVFVFNRDTGACERVVADNWQRPNIVIDFVSGGTRLACQTDDFSISFWDTLSGRPEGHLLQGHNGPVRCVAVNADGTRIVSGSDDATVRVWDAETGNALGDPLQGHTNWVWCVAFSADGTRIVSGSWDKTVRVWDAQTGKAVGHPLQGHTGWVWCVAVSSDGTRIVSGSRDNTVRVWDAHTGNAVGHPLEGHTDLVRCVAVSADGTRIVSGSEDKTVRVWDAQTGNAVGHPLQGHAWWVWCVAVSANGARIVSGSFDTTVRVWNAQTGEVVGRPLQGHTDLVRCVAVSADGTRIVSGSRDKTVCVWDAQTGYRLQGHTDEVICVAVNADGTRIVSGSRDNTVRVWDAQTGNVVGHPLQGHTDEVLCVAVSADGTRIVSGSRDKTVRVWDAQTGNAVGHSLEGHTDLVRCVAVSADRARIVSGSEDKTVRVWDAQTGNAIGHPLQGHTGGVRCVAVSAHGTRIVSGSEDDTVRVWDAETGNALGDPLQVPPGGWSRVAVSADGTHVVSGDGSVVRLWALNEGGTECVRTSRDATWQSTIDGLGLTWGSDDRWKPLDGEVRDLTAEGSDIVLGTCDKPVAIVWSGDVYFSEYFSSCRIVR